MTSALMTIMVILCVVCSFCGLLFGMLLEVTDSLKASAAELVRTRGRLRAACEALRIRGFASDADELS